MRFKVEFGCVLFNQFLAQELEETTHGAALAQWGKRAVLQPQGCGFDPRSPH